MRVWQTIRSSVLDRHVHKYAYAAVVLSGSYDEAGDHGRFRVNAGDVVLHDSFEAHLNRLHSPRANVLNLRLPAQKSFTPGLARVDDPDALARASQTAGPEAVNLLLSVMRPVRPPAPADWPDALASLLIRNPAVNLSAWSAAHGLTPWRVSRGFAQVFGISPCGFRARARARLAWKGLESTQESLVTLSAHLGFADQSHMSRAVKSLTGSSPAIIRSRCKWIQD